MPSLWASIGLNATAFKMGLDRAQAGAAAAGARIGSSLGGAMSSQLAQFAGAAAITGMIKNVIEYGGRVDDMSKQLGISTDAWQQWDYAVSMSGGTMENAASFLGRLAVSRKNALEGNEKAVASFKALGISLDDLKSKRLEDLGVIISRTFQSGDAQQLIADLREVGGKGAGAMVAAFKNGLADMIDEAGKVGAVIDSEVIAKLDQAGDSASRMGKQFRAGIAPAVAFVVQLVEGLWVGLNKVMRGVVGFVTGGTKGAEDLVKEYMAEVEAARKASADKRTNRGPGFVDSDEPTAKELRAVEKILNLREQLFRMQQDNDFKQMTHEQQVAELYRRRAAIAAALAKSQTEEGRLNAAMDLEKINAELLGMKDGKSNVSMASMSANSLQKVGAYVGDATQITTLDIAKKSENHLREISRATTAMANRQAAGKGTTY